MDFPSVRALDSLPYFVNKEGSLHLIKGVLEHGIIDMHTHLGWHYLLTKPFDLWKRGRIRHFFPSDIPVDLDRYSAYDFTTGAKRICEREVVRGSYDTHGYSSTHTVPNILSEMDRLQITHAAVLAIDYPFMSNNSQEQLEAINKSKTSSGRLHMFISLHPLQARKNEILQSYLNSGAVGIKLHPQMQLFRPSDRRAYSLYSLAAKYRTPVLFHTGLSPISPRWQKKYVQPADFQQVFADFPDTIFIIGHAGGAEGYTWAADMAKKFPYVYVETSGQPPYAIEYLIKHIDTEKILYGSDWPFYPMVLPLAKTLLATEKHKKLRNGIFRENAEKLLHLQK